MVKKLLVFYFSFLFLNASELSTKIYEYVGVKKYQTHNNLINVLFKKKDQFYLNKKIDHIKILRKLKENGLLVQNFNIPREFNIEIISFSNYKLLIKTVLDSLSQMGFSYVIIKEAIKVDNKIKLVLSIQTQYIVDPISFDTEITKRGGHITQIFKQTPYRWKYIIDSLSLKLNDAIFITSQSTKLKKTLKDYYLKIDKDNIKKINIKSYNVNRWHPFISCYDKNFNLIKTIKIRHVVFSHKINIDEECFYLRVGDLFTLNNIKKGLIVDAVFK